MAARSVASFFLSSISDFLIFASLFDWCLLSAYSDPIVKRK
jgi:hypothetical protein